ncbi:MAG: hypothetical protein ACYTG5_12455 [Planctomycetota bacterium]|jgi:hypothetical protein
MELSDLRLRNLPLAGRVGASFMILTLIGGLLASGAHVFVHHENRDEQPGLSLDDLTGAYHGVQTRAPLATALERDHPETLSDADKSLLLNWLRSNRISEDYDNLDLGDSAPVEILDARCNNCHGRNATEGEGIWKQYPLDQFDDVKRLAISRDVRPVDMEILLASTHTHALSMAMIALLLSFLALATRFSRGLVGLLVGLAGIGLFVDLACWWLARDSALFVPLLAGAGGLFALSTVSLSLLGLLEMWMPRRAGSG